MLSTLSTLYKFNLKRPWIPWVILYFLIVGCSLNIIKSLGNCESAIAAMAMNEIILHPAGALQREYHPHSPFSLPSNLSDMNMASRLHSSPLCTLSGFALERDMNELWLGGLPPKLGYLHIFKSGGTTIQEQLNWLLDGRWLQMDAHHNPEQVAHDFRHRVFTPSKDESQSVLFRRMLREMTLFTFVRRPVDRMLSGFLELKRRGRGAETNFSELLHSMWTAQRQQKKKKKKKTNILDVYRDRQLMPQLAFVHGADGSKHPLDFVADIARLHEAMPRILAPFWNTAAQRSMHMAQTMDARFKFAHENADSTLLRLQLTDDEVRKICDLYWMDFLCFPFELPPQCDRDKLLESQMIILQNSTTD